MVITDIEALLDEDHPTDPLEFVIYSFSFGGFIATFSYYVILIIILPFVALPKLKKKLGPKALAVYVFVCGITFEGAIDGLYIMLI